MKKFSFFLCLMMALLTSCLPTFKNTVYFTDYRSVAKNGFFVTEANTVSFDYEPIGSMTLNQYNGVTAANEISVNKENGKEKEVTGYDDVYMDKLPEKNYKSEKKKGNYKYATAESALEAFAEEAKSKGADGVIGLRIGFVSLKDSRTGIEVSGMLIRRK